jgi:hypothetical protein
MMLGWAIKISIISILLIMIFHYSQFCFKQDVFAKQTATNDDLKVQKYKNIISALSKQSDLKQTPQVHQSDGKQSDGKQSDGKQTPQVHQSDGKQTPQVRQSNGSQVHQSDDIAIEDMSTDLMDYLNRKTTHPDNVYSEVLQPAVLQPEVFKPEVSQSDSVQSEIIQLEITEINL